MRGGENSDKTKDREIKASLKKNHDLDGIDSWNNLDLLGAEESLGLGHFLDFQNRPS